MNMINLKTPIKYALLIAWIACSNESLDQYITNLDSHDGELRNQAAILLARNGNNAVDALAPLVTTENEILQLLALQILARINTKKAAQTALPALLNNSIDIRLEAIQFLELAPLPDSAVHYFIRASDDSYWKVREKAVSALGRIPSKKSIACLTQHINDKNAKVRATSIKTLVSIGGSDVLEALRASLDNPDEQVRYISVQALGSLGDTLSGDKLIEILLQDQNSWIRQKAAFALAEIKFKKSIPHLQAMYTSKSSSRSEKIIAKQALASFKNLSQ